jgi:hypothetical protein
MDSLWAAARWVEHYSWWAGGIMVWIGIAGAVVGLLYVLGRMIWEHIVFTLRRRR